MKLNFKTFGTGQPLIILHGLFGSLDNWQTIGKGLSEHFRIYLIDQRNHGYSPHSDAFNYELMVADLDELIIDEGLENVYLMGHSMGGKAAMHYAISHPQKVEKLIVIDIAPKYYPPHHADVFEGFHAVKLEEVKSRKDAESMLEPVIKNMGTRLFILKNLMRDDNGGFKWKINLDSLETHIDEVGQGLSEGDLFEGETLFLGGGKSNYIAESDHEMIKGYFPKASIKYVPNAGHWVHADNPKDMFHMIMAFLA